MKSSSKFFLVMIISLVGNSCADYAILWYAIDLADKSVLYPLNSVTLFYVGQSCGAILFAPYLGVFFDRVKKSSGARGLDFLYGIALAVAVCFSLFDMLNSYSIFALSIIISGVSNVYRGSVGFSVLKIFEETDPYLVSKFVQSLTFSHLLGAGVSGFFYKAFGFEFTLLIGIVTFIPSVVLYPKIFKIEDSTFKASEVKKSVFSDMVYGFYKLKNNKLLKHILISLIIFNLCGAVIPSILGVYISKHYSEYNFLFGILIGFGLLLSVLSAKYFSRLSDRLYISFLIPVSNTLLLSLSFVSIFFYNIYILIGLYFSACLASSLRNVGTGKIRVKTIEKKEIGKVNTAYGAGLYIGQALGALFVFPFIQNHSRLGMALFFILVLISCIYSLLLLPSKRLENV